MRGIALILGRTDPSITVTPQQPWPHCIWPMGLTRASILILARARLRLSLGMRRPARRPPHPHGNQRIPKGPEQTNMGTSGFQKAPSMYTCVNVWPCGRGNRCVCVCASTEQRMHACVRGNECMRVCAATEQRMHACVRMSPPPPHFKAKQNSASTIHDGARTGLKRHHRRPR